MELARVDPFQLLDTAKRLRLQTTAPSALATGVSTLDAVLPDAGLPRGQVIELALEPAAGLGTSLALGACRAAQQQAAGQDHTSWCAFVDPSASLYAPAVIEKGVDLRRLLVVRPSLESLTRVVLRLAEAKTFSVIVVDAQGQIGENRTGVAFSQHWVRVIRRLSLAIEGSHTQIILLTDRQAHRSLPLPVGLRLELKRKSLDQLEVRVSKEKRGRITEAQTVRLLKRHSEHPLELVRPLSQSTESEHGGFKDSERAAPGLSLVRTFSAPARAPSVRAHPRPAQVEFPFSNQAETQAEQRPLFPERALGNYSRASR